MRSDTRHSTPPELELVKVTKRFGSFTANEDVSFKVEPGTFHALLGENGAGKSTIVKCIMGYHAADDGDIIVAGASRDIRSPYDACKLGIGMVYQHFTVVPAMTVAENLILARPDLPLFINWKKEYSRLREFLETAPFQVPLEAQISELAAGQKQKVEILKQLYLNSQILILDEPTSVLTPQEADEVLGMMRRMVDDKKLSVLIITHKFREVTTYCDEITILRKGKLAGAGKVKDLTTSEMASMMMGEQRKGKTIQKAELKPGATVLELRDVRANRDNGIEGVCGVSLSVRAGEIVGIAGISGNGQRELVEVLDGQRPATGGEVRVAGEPFHMTRAEISKHQIYVLPEEPLRNACAPLMSVAENIALRTFDRPPLAIAGTLLSDSRVRANGRQWIERFNVKTPGPDAAIGTLSGGNVQRAVLARELGPGTAKALVAANPCFGLDFAAVDFIHSQLLAARNNGVAVLLVCEDLDELLALSDRVVVMNGGKLVYEAPVAEANIREIGERMAG
ncbi:ABC transporter ATP-binding protein [Verrucomicrobia bacterium LW23]|nr:ABC transporter ATP-binding protein [Verrucomicrobia bacterium LW23]